jgi:glutathione S-transferase
MEAALQDNLFLLGEAMSIADINLYVLCGWCNVFDIDLAGWPAAGLPSSSDSRTPCYSSSVVG